MKPASFKYFYPKDLPEVFSLLEKYGSRARLLAGGQSLVPLMNFRLSRPDFLVDLNGISELSFIRNKSSNIEIGAMTRARTIEGDHLIGLHVPMLRIATTQIAHLPIRSRGTIGGSLANADPAAEYPAVALALNMDLVVESVGGERRIAAKDFFLDSLTTALAPNELLTKIIVPKIPKGSGFAFIEIARRRGDFAIAGVATQLTLSGENVKTVSLALFGVGPVPTRLVAAERVILRDGINDKAIKAAATAVEDEIDPIGDLHATAEYRRRLAGVICKRALKQAVSNARNA